MSGELDYTFTMLRRLGVVCVLSLSLAVPIRDAQAQQRGPRVQQPDEGDEVTPERDHPPMHIKDESSYGGWLALAYFVPVAVFIAPPIVHWVHGETGRGFGALGGMAGAILAGVAVGATVGLSVECKHDTAPTCGALIFTGGLAGYVTWGVHDSVNNSDYMRTLPVAAPQLQPVRGGAVGGMHWRF